MLYNILEIVMDLGGAASILPGHSSELMLLRIRFVDSKNRKQRPNYCNIS